MYAPIDERFIKTRIPIKEVYTQGQPMARSQARKILYRLEQFKIVEFDFSEVQIIPVHACPRVLGMMKHVQRESS